MVLDKNIFTGLDVVVHFLINPSGAPSITAGGLRCFCQLEKCSHLSGHILANVTIRHT